MFGCDLHVCYSNRKNLTLGSLWLLLALGMAFSITSFDSIGKCYTVPCVSSMAEVLKVNNGLSLTLLITGFLFILQPVYGIWFMRVRCSQLVGGAYIGASLMVSIIALMTSAQWGSIKAGVNDLDSIIAGHVPAVTNTSYKHAFHALEALSACIFVFGLICVFLLVVSREFFCEDDFSVEHAKQLGQRRKQAGYTYQGVAVSDDQLDDDI
jgi:hypothetical protein